MLRLDPVSGRLDDTNFEARVVPADASCARSSTASTSTATCRPPRKHGASKKKATLEALVAELAKFDLDAEIRIDEARVAGATLRDAVIRVERSGEPAP